MSEVPAPSSFSSRLRLVAAYYRNPGSGDRNPAEFLTVCSAGRSGLLLIFAGPEKELVEWGCFASSPCGLNLAPENAEPSSSGKTEDIFEPADSAGPELKESDFCVCFAHARHPGQGLVSQETWNGTALIVYEMCLNLKDFWQ